jgi:hypothetical protein
VDEGRSPQHIAQLVAAQLHCLDLVDGVGQVAACLREAKVSHLSVVPCNHSGHSVVMVSRFLSPSAGCMGYQATGLPFDRTQVLAHLVVRPVRRIAVRRGGRPSMSSSSIQRAFVPCPRFHIDLKNTPSLDHPLYFHAAPMSDLLTSRLTDSGETLVSYIHFLFVLETSRHIQDSCVVGLRLELFDFAEKSHSSCRNCRGQLVAERERLQDRKIHLRHHRRSLHSEQMV